MKRTIVAVLALVSAVSMAWTQGAGSSGKTYQVVFWEHAPWTRAAQAKPGEDFVANFIKEKYRLDIKIQPAPTDGADAKLNAMVAGGDIPDIIQANWTMGDNIVKEYSEQGIILSLDKYLPDYKFLDTMLDENELPFVKYDGKRVALGQPRPVQNWMTPWVRQDWLDRLGLKAPTTMEELAKVAKVFTTNDPDGNGKNDTYGFTSVTTAGNFFGQLHSMWAPFGAYPGRDNLRIADGKLVMEAFSPEAKNALSWWNAQIKAGVVDPNWSTNKFDNWREAVISGKVGIVTAEFQLIRESNSSTTMGKEIFAANPKAKWVQLPALQGPFGKYTNWNENGTDCRFFVTVKAQSEPGKLQAILAFLNDMMNPKTELYALATFGQVGVDYKRNDEGKVSKKIVVPEHAWKSYWVVFRLGDLDYFYPGYIAEPNDLWGKLNFTIRQPRIANVNGLVPAHERTPDLDAYIQEMHMKFAVGTEPLANWDKFVETARKTYGMDEVRKSAEAHLKKLGYLK